MLPLASALDITGTAIQALAAITAFGATLAAWRAARSSRESVALMRQQHLELIRDRRRASLTLLQEHLRELLALTETQAQQSPEWIRAQQKLRGAFALVDVELPRSRAIAAMSGRVARNELEVAIAEVEQNLSDGLRCLS